ncbi:hypothetical protein [Pacificoceanicola onchidii]|uniref:hypothetical protein n=1 Tax=Pacificoceanicola onchidii TaxID=2562685 RepID=UPI0010A679F4|nr:hypothetical protein [Pacificoceanicola onchidii]
MALELWLFFGALAAFSLFGIWVLILRQRRYRKRRDSLHQDSSGSWVWTDFDGSPRSSLTHPDRKGGDWYSEPGGDGFDAGGGGDGGGGD